MAREQKANVTLTAVDKASQTIRDVDAKAKELEGEHKVELTADDQASDEIADVKKAASDLDGRKVAVTVETNDTASRKLDDVDRKRRDLDGRKAEVRVDVDDNATRVLDDIQSKLRNLGRGATTGAVDASGLGGLGIGGGAAGVGAGLVGATVAGGVQAVDMALMVEQVAKQTGASVEEAGRLVAVWQRSGLDVADLLDILFNVNDVLADQPELADQLGVQIGRNTTLIDIFLQALHGVNTEFDTVRERARASAQLFGEEGVRQIGRVETRLGDIQTAMDELSESEFVGEDDIETAKKLNEEWVEAKGHWQQIELSILRAFAFLTNGVFNNPLRDPGDFIRDAISGPNQGVTATGARNLTAAELARGIDPNRPGVFVSGVTGEPRPWWQAPAAAWNVLEGGARIVNVFNPPGSATTTVTGSRLYEQRNDVRFGPR